MDVPDEGVLDVDMLGDEGSDDEGEAPQSSDFYGGPASTPTSCASSPREEPASPHGTPIQPAFFHQQQYVRPFFMSARRGPGRPRKEGVKLAKEGKIVRRYRNPGSIRGAKRHRGSRDDALEDLLDEDDFTMPAPEEPPYFPEKWPGKLCALCNLGERSQLGQGEMKQFPCILVDADGNPIPSVPSSGGATPTSTAPGTPGGGCGALGSPPPESDGQPSQNAPLSRRQKGIHKCKTPLYNMEHTDELSIIGYIEPPDLSTIVSNSLLYIHRSCLEFSPPFQDLAEVSEDDKEIIEEKRVKSIVTASLAKKCSFCQRHGASIPCKTNCNKYFHWPCVLASGGFLDFQSKIAICKDHLYQVPLVCSEDIDCRMCRVVGDVSNLMTCVTCGGHYHGTCVGLAQLPGVRAGWSCRSCRVCQVCRGEASGPSGPAGPERADPRSVTCEHCDKMYHAACLRPVMATVPKYGWKCKCCRVCSDCGARSPGAGPSSRWHAHYTVCDSCYQQRNKGSCCPLCRRAYRAAAMRDMTRCALCRRYVHGMCDPEAEPLQYRTKKDQNPSYDYHCPICKTQVINNTRTNSFESEDGNATPSHDSSFGDDLPPEQDPLALEPKTDIGLGKGKPYTVSSKVAKKKMGSYKMKGGYPATGKLGFQKRQRSGFLDFGRKRGTKPKMRGVFGVPGLGLQRPQAPDSKTADDDPGGENKLIICSSKDKFVLTQDLCVMCGAIGTDSEGCLIACSQCGQTYHPYCVNIKVSKVIVTLGWRCLDCTVCEGCGLRGDDALLVLCDDCDTAHHTYCAKPTLPEVPAGSWRCERCRRCLTCGTTETDNWCENYTECGPCASQSSCALCLSPYSEGELMIQCSPCRRWLHAACDHMRGERDADLCSRAGYSCPLCRGRDVPPPHLLRPSPARPPPTPQSLGLAGEYFVDDVCLSQKGANHMKLLEAEMGVTHTRRKRRFKNELLDPKDALVQSVDVDAGDDTKPDSTADNRDDTGLLGNTNFKEGTRWNVGTEGPPPEGFTIYTTESGVTVLRRKRQRNLNKLGIGGFVVRQRQVSSKNQPDDEMDGTMPSGAESPNNKRKPRRKTRSKLMEQYPSYMQEAFFGKDLLEPGKHVITSTGNPLESPGGTIRSVTPEGYRELRDFRLDDNSDSDADDILPALALYNRSDHTIYIALNKEEVELLNSLKPKDEKDDGFIHDLGFRIKSEDGIDDTHLKHTEDSTALRNAILGPAHPPEIEPVTVNEAIPTVHGTKVENMGSDTGRSSVASTISPKDDLSLLGVTLDAMVRDSLPDMDSNDVDEIFKGVLTDDSQESQESSVSYVTNTSLSAPYSQHSRQQLQSPMDYASPYHHTDYGSGQPQLSPAFSESSAGAAPSWPPDSQPPPPATYNQRSADKMRADESLGLAATISAVLYANTNHPEWKMEFPSWVDRCKQILKKWRALPSEQKAPYLQRARENRSAIRMKKAQQTGAQATAASPSTSSSGAGSVATSVAVVTSAATSEAEPVRAPNVTVTANGLLEADAHIRVLTPSEIMRTLPPLHATTTATSTATSTTATEQERACGPQRSAREAEQERQWKQLQQLRQQQTQQQQQIIQDQRLQVSRLSHKAALQRMRSPEGEVVGNVGEAPRSVFPAQRFPLHYANDDINRQLRDLLQRHPDKMWPPQSEDGTIAVTVDGQQFRPPLPVGLRPRLPLQPGQRPDHPMIIQHRMSLPQQSLIVSGGMPVQGQEHKLQDNTHHIGNSEDKPNTSGETSGEDITMGDMDKDEQDSGNIGEVGDILPSLSGEDDEELLESLTAEIGEEFNILEYADPELAAFNDAGHLLDGLELADDAPPERHVKRELGEIEQKFDEKIESNLQAVRNSMQNLQSTIKTEIKSELEDVKTEMEVKPSEILHPVSTIRQMYMDGVQRVITQNLSMQTQLIKSEVKLEAGEMKEEWPSVVQAPSQRFQQIPIQQRVIQQQLPMQGMGQRSAMSQLQRPQIHFANNPHALHVAQGNNQVGSPRGVVTMARGPPPKLLASDVRPGAGSVPRAPPPYPGTLRHQPPPPPYPQMDPAASWVGPGVAARWPPRPLLLQNVNQEQPLLLEELLEQEKREQERDTDWGVATVGVAPPMAVQQVGVANGTTPAVPLFTGTAPPAPPPPPERILTDADRHAHAVYEHWLQQNNVFVTDQLRHYEAEVQKLRKMRKSLNSKQRQLRKSGNELMPTDAAELQRISTEQAALQKHLEAARKQARQHGMTIQEYETKHRQPPPTPQPTQQQQQPMGQQQQLANTNQTIYVQNPNLAQARGRLLPGGRTLVIERTIPRAAPPRPPRAAMSPLHVQSPHSPLHLNSPMQQSPLHQQQSPLHQQQTQILQQQSQMHQQHQQQSQLQQSQIHQQNQMLQQQPTIIHAQQSPIHQQQSPLHQQQSPLQHQQQSQMMPQQSPMHSQQSPMHQQQSPMHQQQSPMHQQQSPMHQQQSPMHQQTQMHNQQPQQMASQQSQLHQQTAMHPQQSPIHHPQQSPIHHPQQSPIHHPQQSPIHHPQQSPIHHPQQSPIHHPQQSPLHQQSSMLPQQSPMQQSPMHSQQSPMHTQQSPMQTSMSPQHFLQQLQAQRTSPQLPPPSRSPQIYQQQQQILSPALSPAPEYSSRFPRPAPACSPASGRFPRPHMQQGMRVSFGGRQTSPLGSPQPLQSPGNPNTESMTRQQILQRGQFSPMAGAPLSPLSRSPLLARTATPSPVASPPAPPTPGLRGGEPNSVFPPKFRYRRAGLRGGAPGWPAKDRHVTKVSILKRRTPPNAEPAAEPIATEEDFERLIDNNQADEEEQPPATKTVAVISLASQNNQNVQYKILAPSSSHPNSKLINEVAQTTVASVSIANQTISVPVFKNLNVPLGEHSGAKKVPLNLSNQSLNLYVQNPQMSKPMSSVISVISSNIPKMAGLSPVITLATSNTVATPTRVPVSMFSQQQVKQKIVKTIEKPIGLSLSNTKLSSLSVSHDTTLPAKIFQDEAASPDSTVTSESSDKLSQPGPSQVEPMQITEDKLVPKKDIDIESEISQQTELPHTLCMTERQPLMLGKTDIKSPDPVPEKIPDNIMEGDDDDKPEDMISNQQNIMLPFNKPQSTQLPPPHPSHSEQSQVDVNVVQTIKAIANQTKDMVIDSNMQITSELAQESVQISIPSPTPSQEQYLNHITMQQHTETGEGSEKHVGLYHDMLHMLENISDDPKQYPGKQLPKPNLAPPKPEHKDLQDNKPPSYINKPREHENINQNIIQAATVPQLSPLSQPTELTTNMANVSQQLRTIMSSLNTTKVETTTNLALRKPNDSSPLQQVNFENFLPSSKVEVVNVVRPQPILKPGTVMMNPEAMPMNAAQLLGSRVNTLSSMSQTRKSPNASPINSPVMQGNLIKSPAQSPLIANPGNQSEEMPTITSCPTSQIIQMPALSTIHRSSGPQTVLHTNSGITTMSNIHKNQTLPTSILSNTLLQPNRQMTTNVTFHQQSSSQPPALVMTSRPVVSGNKMESPPNVTLRTHNILNTGLSQMQGLAQASKQTGSINFISSSTLLHTQLTSPLKRSKSTDEPKSEVIVGHIQPTKRHSVESVIVKSEPMETDDMAAGTAGDACKLLQQSTTQKNDESQNVLLKQLLQTTTATTTVIPPRSVSLQRTAPALGTIPSLEAQLARPVIPPPTLPLSQEIEIPKSSPRPITSQNPTFINRPTQITVPTASMSPLIQTSTQSLMDVRKQPTPKLMETTPLPETSPTMKSVQMYSMNIDQQIIKKEITPPLQSPVHRPITPMDVKKELIDESSQQSAASGVSTASDQGKLDHPIKEEFPENVGLDAGSEVMAPETPSEAKKRKRREYQQKKRKQMQMNMKAAAEINTNAANAKKRPRKGSRFEEDYDTYIDNLMSQLRILPPMQIQEPALTTNFAVCPLFGSGDLTKLKNKDYDILKGDLVGEFGNARIPNVADYYNTKPFGEEEPLPEKPAASTQRGFYDQEFQPIVFDDDPEDKKLEFICKERDTDTPDSIVSCSSDECYEIEPPNRFPGIKLTDDDDDEEDGDSPVSGRMSPVVPLIAPVPIRLKPVLLYQVKDEEDVKPRPMEIDLPLKPRVNSPGNTDVNENVTVTLTLTSGAAEDIMGVLKELAGILHIPPPTSYQIVERTATPPSHKLGLYRSKGRDGKEGTPIDIQSILNGAAKFCRHCDVVILDSVVRAKASEFPLLSGNGGMVTDGDTELYFCGTQCYERFSWRPTDLSKEERMDTDVGDCDTASAESADEKAESPGSLAGVKYKRYSGRVKPVARGKRTSDRELAELVFRYGAAVRPVGQDVRRCELCGLQGDGVADGVARLLNCDADRWVHLNCALWSDGVYETVSGALVNVDSALAAAAANACAACRRLGATVRCFKLRCGSVYHLGCAVKDNCVFYKNKTAYCASHAPKGEKDNELTTLSVQRRVYISRDEQRQVASVMLHCDTNHLLRIGGLIFLSPGHLLPHQLAAFHTPNYIYPIGYKIVRFYWSWRRANSRSRYVCWISEHEGRPRFHVQPQDEPQHETHASTARAAWEQILDAVSELRGGAAGGTPERAGVLRLWPQYITGEDLFGLTEPSVVRVLESLPGIETLSDYRFKFGRSALLEGGLAVNPSGCARAEPRARTHWRRALVPAPAPLDHAPNTPHSTSHATHGAQHSACPYTKQFVHTKSSQYKKMKMEWRHNVYLARSKIQGLGLYAARDIEKHTMVIEYIGELIRSELSEIREKQYEAKNRGIYMFRLDERRVVDATLCGGLARYINHSCQPNCVAETVEVDRQLRIIIFAKRRIARGEELAYDYKFDIEDDANKIMCMCGAPNCRKWMN